MHPLSKKLFKSSNQQPAAPAIVEPVLITELQDLPLYDFVTCYVGNDYAPLIKSGTPDNATLARAWMHILSEHFKFRGDRFINKRVELETGLRYIEHRAEYLGFLLDSLKGFYFSNIAELLRQEHPSFDLSPESYISDIEKIKQIEQRCNHDYAELKMQLDGLDNSAKAGTPPTQETFIEILMDINQVEKSSYSFFARPGAPGYIDTYTYSVAYKRREKYVESMKELQAKNQPH